MRALNLPLCVFLGVCAVSFTLHAGEETSSSTNRPLDLSNLPPETARLTAAYRNQLLGIATNFNEAIKSLPGAYLNQLAELRAQLHRSGELDGLLAVDKEVKRFNDAIKGDADPFEKIPEMPENVLVDKPEVLKQQQEQYRKLYSAKIDIRRKQIEAASNAYINKLEALQKDMTIKDRIRDAVAIKNVVAELRKSLADESLVSQALTLMQKAAPTSRSSVAASTPTIPVFGQVPEWSKWAFSRSGNFAREGYLFKHPDLPDQLSLDFNERNGRGRIDGRCEVESMLVDMRQRSWFGKAVEWQVKDLSTLNATFILQSKDIAAGEGSGPVAHLVLLNEKGIPLGDGLDVTLMWHDATITIIKDTESSKCALCWVEGKGKDARKIVNLPANGGVLVRFGITVHNPGERCNTAITMQ
jgi:hypothetical protein